MGLSRALVLAHLDRWSGHPNLLVASVAEGMMTAINRGDLDEGEEETECQETNASG